MTDYTKLIERAKEQRDRDAAEHCPAEIIALQDEVIAGLEALEAENLGLRLECQGLKAEVAEVKSFWKEAQLRNRNLLEESNDLAFLADQYKAERDALQAKLDELQRQEPIGFVIKDSDYTNSIIREQGGHYTQPVYAAPKALEPFERVAECAARLVEHADFQLGGILSADSKAKDIPSKAVSQVKSRHLAALRDSLASHGIGGTP